MITQDAVLDIARDAIYTIVIVAAPMLLTALIVGLIISIFQTVTSIQEQTLTFVPKIVAVFLVMILAGSWMLNTMLELITELWSNFSYFTSM
ncbi:MAG: flagellar biosynthesis protein FliQ [Lachnospiraceae bacterium]|nr:flagellar biosynthesis protein FliQ [Lachnospiraceae bacterium]